MQIKAAVLWERGKPLTIDDVVIDPPGEGEVLVEMAAAGVCHSDLHAARGDWPMRTPLVLGHEGAGIVREVGAGVTTLRAGDHVVLCWAPKCGACPFCQEGRAVLCDRLDRTTYRNRLPSGAARLHARDRDLNPFLATACFAEYVVVAAEGAVKVDNDLPFDALATLGCAVVTGVGAVLNAAQPPPGATIAVIGAGGVGLNVIQGGRLARVARTIAIDIRPAPLRVAAAFGATDLVESPSNTGEAVRELTAGLGADVVFDTVGTPATLADAYAATRKGGSIVLTGLSRVDAVGQIPAFPFVLQEKRLIGSSYGSRDPARDIVTLTRLFQDGELKLRELVSRTYALAEVNDALEALANGGGARGIIVPENR